MSDCHATSNKFLAEFDKLLFSPPTDRSPSVKGFDSRAACAYHGLIEEEPHVSVPSPSSLIPDRQIHLFPPLLESSGLVLALGEETVDPRAHGLLSFMSRSCWPKRKKLLRVGGETLLGIAGFGSQAETATETDAGRKHAPWHAFLSAVAEELGLTNALVFHRFPVTTILAPLPSLKHPVPLGRGGQTWVKKSRRQVRRPL